MFDRIDRVILPARDASKAAERYEREFEFRVARRGSREIDLQVHRGETLLTLTEPEPGEPFRPLPSLHSEGHVPCFNFYTHWEDLHRDWLGGRGLPTTEVMRTPHMNVCEMADGDGNVVGICHEKASSLYFTPPEGAPAPMFHRVLAVFLPVRDLEASVRWYTEALGFSLYHHWGDGADLKVGDGETIVTMIRMDEPTFRRAREGVRDRPYFSLRTANIHETYRALAAIGATADRCAEQDGVSRFHARSPEGIRIRISEKERVRIG
ncbi:VOC family protein [Paenibacillus sp.]|uniref:VOC family protein n=1 Tax=Paenibacillus sp. TaxID=58172 RepID=UPI00281118B3|nr:VOC family protein [Paenibacillus sp.]